MGHVKKCWDLEFAAKMNILTYLVIIRSYPYPYNSYKDGSHFSTMGCNSESLAVVGVGVEESGVGWDGGGSSS